MRLFHCSWWEWTGRALIAGLLVGSSFCSTDPSSCGQDNCPMDMATACVEDWTCTAWTTTGTGNQGTRTCTDKNACGTTALMPQTSVTLPALDFNYYKCNVEPILDKKCAQLACHGTETDRALRTYARGRLRNDEMIPVSPTSLCFPGVSTISLATQCTGGIHCECTAAHTATEWQRNFDSARFFGLDANLRPIAPGMEDTSDLLAQPKIGGKIHSNIHVYASTDPDYMTIKSWLGGATLATCNPLPN